MSLVKICFNKLDLSRKQKKETLSFFFSSFVLFKLFPYVNDFGYVSNKNKINVVRKSREKTNKKEK